MPRSFDGNTANHVFCNPVVGNFATLAAWINLTSVGTAYAICGGWTTGDRSSLLHITSAGKLRFNVDCPPAGFVQGATTLPTGQWIHVAGKYDGTNSMKVYLNGAVDGSGSGPNLPGTTVLSSGVFEIGYRNESGLFSFNGLIADVGYWTDGLSDEKIAALAAGVSPSRLNTTLGLHVPLWGFDSPELDLRQGVGATIVGTVPASTDFPFVGSPWSADG